jgi:hypothetical protein
VGPVGNEGIFIDGGDGVGVGWVDEVASVVLDDGTEVSFGFGEEAGVGVKFGVGTNVGVGSSVGVNVGVGVGHVPQSAGHDEQVSLWDGWQTLLPHGAAKTTFDFIKMFRTRRLIATNNTHAFF